MKPRGGLARASHVRLTVLVYELPLSLHEQGFEVVIWIASLVSRRSVADFEINDFFSCFVQQALSVTSTRFEARAHSRRELGSAFVGVQCRPPLQDVDEFVLPSVGVAKRRNSIGCQTREVYAKISQTK